MSTTIATISATALATDVEIDALTNCAHLEDLRMAGAVNEANPLILGVEAKVDAGKELTPIEYAVLWNAITSEVVEFLGQHRELLG